MTRSTALLRHSSPRLVSLVYLRITHSARTRSCACACVGVHARPFSRCLCPACTRMKNNLQYRWSWHVSIGALPAVRARAHRCASHPHPWRAARAATTRQHRRARGNPLPMPACVGTPACACRFRDRVRCRRPLCGSACSGAVAYNISSCQRSERVRTLHRWSKHCFLCR